MRLMRVKQSNILKVYPSDCYVKVIRVVKPQEPMLSWLVNYWKQNHDVKVPKIFKIAVCLFSKSEKEYAYPIIKECIKKPKLQFVAKKKWKQPKQNKTIIKTEREKRKFTINKFIKEIGTNIIPLYYQEEKRLEGND